MTFVYVIGADGGAHKVGISADPVSRLAALQTSTHVQLALAETWESASARTVERLAHAILSARHLSGEWFDVNKADAVAAVQSALAMVAVGDLSLLRQAKPIPGQRGRKPKPKVSPLVGDWWPAFYEAECASFGKQTVDARIAEIEAQPVVWAAT